MDKHFWAIVLGQFAYMVFEHYLGKTKFGSAIGVLLALVVKKEEKK